MHPAPRHLRSWPTLPPGRTCAAAASASPPAWSALILPNAAAAGDLMVATSANTIGSVVDVATGSVLVSGGVGVAPAWSASPTVTKLLAGDGTALLPSLTFASQPTQGLYSRSASYLGLTIQAVERVGFNISGLTLQAAGAFGFSSNTDPGTGPDTTLTRGGAGKLAITGTTPMLQLGGTTSSFPALKRSGAQLQARLAGRHRVRRLHCELYSGRWRIDGEHRR
jgi:hypothetical protein